MNLDRCDSETQYRRHCGVLFDHAANALVFNRESHVLGQELGRCNPVLVGDAERTPFASTVFGSCTLDRSSPIVDQTCAHLYRLERNDRGLSGVLLQDISKAITFDRKLS